MWHMGSWFSNWGLNLCPLHWRAWSLNQWTTRQVPGAVTFGKETQLPVTCWLDKEGAGGINTPTCLFFLVICFPNHLSVPPTSQTQPEPGKQNWSIQVGLPGHRVRWGKKENRLGANESCPVQWWKCQDNSEPSTVENTLISLWLCFVTAWGFP